jgi:hypothetical protein
MDNVALLIGFDVVISDVGRQLAGKGAQEIGDCFTTKLGSFEKIDLKLQMRLFTVKTLLVPVLAPVRHTGTGSLLRIRTFIFNIRI